MEQQDQVLKRDIATPTPALIRPAFRYSPPHHGGGSEQLDNRPSQLRHLGCGPRQAFITSHKSFWPLAPVNHA